MIGDQSYLCKVPGCENVWKRHVDQILLASEVVERENNRVIENVERLFDPVYAENKPVQKDELRKEVTVDFKKTNINEDNSEEGNSENQEKADLEKSVRVESPVASRELEILDKN